MQVHQLAKQYSMKSSEIVEMAKELGMDHIDSHLRVLSTSDQSLLVSKLGPPPEPTEAQEPERDDLTSLELSHGLLSTKVNMLEAIVKKLEKKLESSSFAMQENTDYDIPGTLDDINTVYSQVTLNCGGKQVKKSVPSDIANRCHQPIC